MKKIACALLALMSMNATAQLQYQNRPPEKSRNISQLEKDVQKMVMATAMIYNYYVDSVDSKRLAEDAINGILSKLDPHSAYSNAKETKKFTEPLEGSFEGIGVQFNVLEDTLVVIQPVPKGPSEKVGIVAGDRIVSVNDTAIAGVKMSREEIMHRLRGRKGSHVDLGVVRREIQDTLHFDVVRDKIPVNSVDAAYMVTPTIGLIRFNNFAQTTHDEVVEAIKKLREQGMVDLIIDLQQNGGGYLQAAADLASEFLQKDDLIVYTRGRSVPNQEFRSSGSGLFTQGKVAVLVDEYSASAAEILSGAIQDQDRGIVVGRRTFGKGLVQLPMDLPHNASMKLTTAKYYIPSGRCIQAINYKHTGGGYKEHVPDSLTHVFYTRNGREVRDGGGIMPDIEIKPDTMSNILLYLDRIDSTEVMFDYVVDYISKHPTIAPADKFHLTDAEYADFTQQVLKAGFTYDQISKKQFEELIKTAKFEGYYDDAKAEFEALKAKLDHHDIEHDLQQHRNEIQRQIEQDIISAYYFQSGQLLHMLQTDKTLKEAERILNTSGEYEKLLSPKKVK